MAAAVVLIGAAAVYAALVGQQTGGIPSAPTAEDRPSSVPTSPEAPPPGSLVYRDSWYGFAVALPDSWRGYSVLTGIWEGYAAGAGGESPAEQGPLVSIRHPKWSVAVPRQDIPIMVFTIGQWQALRREEFHIGAAPIGPSELARNSRYVFALPARYNYAFPAGFEEVEEILAGDPLTGFEPVP